MEEKLDAQNFMKNDSECADWLHVFEKLSFIN